MNTLKELIHFIWPNLENKKTFDIWLNIIHVILWSIAIAFGIILAILTVESYGKIF
jgi:hypothetical protein